MLSSNIWLVATVLDSLQHFTVDSAVLDIVSSRGRKEGACQN